MRDCSVTTANDEIITKENSNVPVRIRHGNKDNLKYECAIMNEVSTLMICDTTRS